MLLFCACEWKYVAIFLSVNQNLLSRYNGIKFIVYLINGNILLYTTLMYFNTLLYVDFFHSLYKVNYIINIVVLIFLVLYLFFKGKISIKKYNVFLVLLLYFVVVLRTIDIIVLVLVSFMVYFSERLGMIRLDYVVWSLFGITLIYFINAMKLSLIVCECLLICEYFIPLIIERKLNYE